MRLLLDTHLLLWGARTPERLSNRAIELIEDLGNQLFFSSVSICEIAIKQALGRSGFDGDAKLTRSGLLRNGYEELTLTGDHALALLDLAPIHKDPFDRMLLAQATSEGLTLLTNDEMLARYSGPVLKV